MERSNEEYDREQNSAEAAQEANDAKLRLVRRHVADQCGMTYDGENDDGEDEYIGTITQWQVFEAEYDLYLETGRLTEHND